MTIRLAGDAALETVERFARTHRVAVVLTFDPNAGNVDGSRGAWRAVIDRKPGGTVGGAPAGAPPRTWNEPAAIAWGSTPDAALALAMRDAAAGQFGPAYMPTPPSASL